MAMANQFSTANTITLDSDIVAPELHSDNICLLGLPSRVNTAMKRAFP